MKELGYDVTALGSRDADLRRSDGLDRFSSESYERIFHLAAWTQAGDFCLHHPGEQWIHNQQINTTVLSWWAEKQPRAKLISMGTSCSYPVGILHAEENYLLGEPIADLYTYAMTKRMLLIGQQSLHKQFGLCYLTAIPSTLYGPHYHTGSTRQMHFIFDLIRKFLRLKHEGEPVILWGDGHQKRELVFVTDFVNTLLDLDKILENDHINIGAGEEFSIREFAAAICDVLGIDPAVVQYDTNGYVGAKAKSLSNKKLDAILPVRNFVPLADGLRKTIFWLEAELYGSPAGRVKE